MCLSGSVRVDNPVWFGPRKEPVTENASGRPLAGIHRGPGLRTAGFLCGAAASCNKLVPFGSPKEPNTNRRESTPSLLSLKVRPRRSFNSSHSTAIDAATALRKPLTHSPGRVKCGPGADFYGDECQPSPGTLTVFSGSFTLLEEVWHDRWFSGVAARLGGGNSAGPQPASPVRSSTTYATLSSLPRRASPPSTARS